MSMRIILGLSLTVLLCMWTTGQGNPPDKSLKVRAIYPAGEEVSTSDRITIEFNQNIVVLGPSMYVDDVVPVDIEPALDCEWNWVKLNMLQCELPEDSNLTNSTKYTVTVRPGIRAPNGQMMNKEYVHVFETTIPAVKFGRAQAWKSPTEPILRVIFNQEVEIDSLRDRLFLVDSVSGKEISTTICPTYFRLDSKFRDDFFGRKQTSQVFERENCGIKKNHDDSVLVLPNEPFAPQAKVSLLLLPGVKGAAGELRSKEREFVETDVTTFGDFRFLGLSCPDGRENRVFHPVDQSDEIVCTGINTFVLHFSSPFQERPLNQVFHLDPTVESVGDRWMGYGWRRLPPSKSFGYFFSGDLRPNTSYRLAIATKDRGGAESNNLVPARDGFGRPLIGTNEIAFRIRQNPHVVVPQVVVNSNSNVEPHLLLRNVDEVKLTYDTLDEKGVVRGQVKDLRIPEQNDMLEVQILDLRSVLRSAAGVMSGTIVGKPRFDYWQESINSLFIAQATPYSIFLKLGPVNTLAWVVDLQTGKPVAATEVEFYLGNPRNLGEVRESVFSGTTNMDGTVSLPGYETYDPYWNRGVTNFPMDCQYDRDCPMYFLRVTGNAGIGLLPLISDYKIHGYVRAKDKSVKIDHWATTSQDLYLRGDIVQIKGFIRTRRNDIRVIPNDGHFALCVIGPDESEFEITPISVNEFGSYHTSLTLNNNAKLGKYSVYAIFNAQNPVSKPCSHKYGGSNASVAFGGSFTVFQLKRNPVKVTHSLNAQHYEFGDRLTMKTRAILHAGGPHAHATGQLDIRLSSADPRFDSLPDDAYIISRNRYARYVSPLFATEFQLDDKGTHETSFGFQSDVYYGELRVESSVMSNRGDSITSHTTVPYFGVDQFVAIRQPESLISRFGVRFGLIKAREPWPIEILVVSKDDEIMAETEVQITVYTRKNDPYAEDPLNFLPADIEWEETFDCTLVSTLNPVSCDFTPSETGLYRVDARIVDSRGNIQLSSINVEAIDDNENSWVRADAWRTFELELNCGSPSVKIGDTIRCEVKNLLGNSPTLVSIERSSVIDHWLVQLDPHNPVFEFPVLRYYEPHFELSVLNLSPRSGTNNTQDPLFRIGSKKFKLDNPRLEPLAIAVSTNRDSYEPLEKVKLSISVNEDKDRKIPTEFAIAVIDEALLGLNGDDRVFFNPTMKIWRSSKNKVQTFGLIATLLEDTDLRSPSSSIPDFNLNLALSMNREFITNTFTPISNTNNPFGIDRQADPKIRKSDQFLAYWNPSVVSNNGRLKVDFVLPDKLTNWKVLVMAVSTKDQFGYAETSFISAKDTEVRPVLPNVVTEGDSFQVGASILNRADRSRRLRIELKASGALDDGSDTSYEQNIHFEPFERKLITLDVKAGQLPQPLDLRHPIKAAEIRVVASAGDRRDNDAIDVRIPVRSSKVRQSSVFFGALDGEKTAIPIEFPTKIATDKVQLDFSVSSNTALNFDGVFRDAQKYSHSSWEQKLTQAILAMQYLQLEEGGATHGIHWPDPEGLIKSMLDTAVDHQLPTGGMAYFMPRNYSDDPYLSAYTAIAFSWLENAGYEIPQEVKRKLLEYLREYLQDIKVRIFDGTDQGDKIQIEHLQATVSAVVLHALAILGELQDSELTDFSHQIGQMDLFGLSHYLMALLHLDPTHSLNQTVFERIMDHRSVEYGKAEFVESVPIGFTKILHSDRRSLCSVMEALTKVFTSTSIDIENDELRAIFKTIRFARQYSPHSRNSQDNVFCTSAMITYFDSVDTAQEEYITSVALRSDDTGISTLLADGWKFNSNVNQLHSQHTLTSQLFGTRGAIDFDRQGSGTAFYSVELSYLTTVDQRLNRFSGFEVDREYVVYRDKQWYVLKPGDEIYTGEYVLVNIYLDNRIDRHHVVLDDSVPGGLEPVNSNLKTATFFLPYKEFELRDMLSTSELYREFEDAQLWSFGYRELGLQNVRYFSDRLWRGKHHLLWLGQAISAGEFTVLPTHVEEMYRPIMFGKSEPWTLTVKTK